MYDYEMTNYGALIITTPAGTCLMQGDEANDTYDQLEAITRPDILEMVLSEYEHVCS